MISRVDNAARRIQDQRMLWIPLKVTKDFVQRCNFFGKVLRFPLRVGGRIRPAHPCGHAIDSRIAARSKPPRKFLLDAVIAAGCGNSGFGDASAPKGFSCARHADKRNPQRRLCESKSEEHTSE